MELVDLIRALWRRRLLAIVGVLASLALAAKAVTKPPGPASGFAHTRVMLELPKSQLVVPFQEGEDSMLWRSHLIADLMTTTETTKAIAQAAHVPADQLRIQQLTLYDSIVPTPLPLQTQKTAAIIYQPYVLTVRYAWNLPVIEVEAAAPNADAAGRLATAASKSLQAE